MPKSRHKIALLFCGGSAIVDGEKVISVQKAADIAAWLKVVPEISLIADIEPVFIFGEDASEIKPALWGKLANEIHSRINKYDGFVVTHGVDTMIYTSAMISYMLQNFNKPVIFTGSPLSAEVTESDKQDLSGLISGYRSLGVKANLINAIQVATMDIAETAIMFGNRLIRARQAMKSDAPSFNFFEAYKEGMLGKVDFGIKLFNTVNKRSRQKARLNHKIEERVCLMQLYPGAGPEILSNLINKKCQGIIVKSFHTNLFPDNYKPILEKAYKNKIPVVAHNLSALDIKKKKREYILVNNMTFENTFVRFMWALGQTRDLGKLRILMWEDFDS
ncbi:asparaginase [Patescibacteria group bacterium]|nr:asparaginase [Patescibacteria group bacterium]MBU0963872.1 asparaginase [Patescibacteria group bacterium]